MSPLISEKTIIKLSSSVGVYGGIAVEQKLIAHLNGNNNNNNNSNININPIQHITKDLNLFGLFWS